MNDFTRKMIEGLKAAGIPVTEIKVVLTPEQEKRQRQIEKDVHDYIMKIEEAHKKAAKSKLRFGAAVG